jgi:branched-chain amino acid transport system ATP-binding protein
MTLLSTAKLTKRFGGLVAVDHVNLTIKEGLITSIIGPNGAGKTTLFNLFTGLLRPDSGRVYFDGKDVTFLPTHKLTREGIARSFQVLNIFPDMTLFENISISVQVQKGHGFELLLPAGRFTDVTDSSRKIIEQMDLQGKEDLLAGNLAYGDKRILEIAIALASNPRLLLLDEPTSGLPAKETARITDLIKNLSRTITVVVIEHDMNLVLSISDQIAVLHQGRLIAEGSPDEIKQNEQAQEAYLGGLA